MNFGKTVLWGFVATVVLTTLLSAARGIGFTRMDIPYMLGTMLTADRDRAKWQGFVFHLFNGWAFALIYAAAMASIDLHTWWFGSGIGLVHALFVLVTGMQLLPSIHPRMASEKHGPDVTRQLEPPGFLALNYGRGTPIMTIIAHLVYGGILGAFA